MCSITVKSNQSEIRNLRHDFESSGGSHGQLTMRALMSMEKTKNAFMKQCLQSLHSFTSPYRQTIICSLQLCNTSCPGLTNQGSQVTYLALT